MKTLKCILSAAMILAADHGFSKSMQEVIDLMVNFLIRNLK